MIQEIKDERAGLLQQGRVSKATDGGNGSEMSPRADEVETPVLEILGEEDLETTTTNKEVEKIAASLRAVSHDPVKFNKYLLDQFTYNHHIFIPRKTFFSTKKDVTTTYQKSMKEDNINDHALNVHQSDIRYKYHQALLEVNKQHASGQQEVLFQASKGYGGGIISHQMPYSIQQESLREEFAALDQD